MGGQIIDNSRREYEAGTNIGTGLAQGIQYREQFRYQAAKDALAEMLKGISMSDIPEVAYRENIGQMGALLNEMQSVGGGTYFQSDPALKDPKTQSALAGIEQYYRQHGYGAKTLINSATHVLNLGEYPPFSQEELKKGADNAVKEAGIQTKKTEDGGGEVSPGKDWWVYKTDTRKRVDGGEGYLGKFDDYANWAGKENVGGPGPDAGIAAQLRSGKGSIRGVPDEKVTPDNLDEMYEQFKKNYISLLGKAPNEDMMKAQFGVHTGQYENAGFEVQRAMTVPERDDIRKGLTDAAGDAAKVKVLVQKYGADKVAYTQMLDQVEAKFEVAPASRKTDVDASMEAIRPKYEKLGTKVLTPSEQAIYNNPQVPTSAKESMLNAAREREMRKEIQQFQVGADESGGTFAGKMAESLQQTPAATSPEAPASTWSQMQANVQQRAAANVGGNAPALDPNTTLGQMASKNKNIEQMFASKTPGIQMMDRLETVINSSQNPQQKAAAEAKYEQVYTATLAADGKTAKQLSDMLAHDRNYRKAQMVKDKVLQEATTGDLRINSEEARLYRYACTKEQDATVWQMRMMQNKETRDAIMREVNDRLSGMSPEMLAIGFGSDVANVRLNEMQINAQIEEAEANKDKISAGFLKDGIEMIIKMTDSTSRFGKLTEDFRKFVSEQQAVVKTGNSASAKTAAKRIEDWMITNDYVNAYNEEVDKVNAVGYLIGVGDFMRKATPFSVKEDPKKGPIGAIQQFIDWANSVVGKNPTFKFKSVLSGVTTTPVPVGGNQQTGKPNAGVVDSVKNSVIY